MISLYVQNLQPRPKLMVYSWRQFKVLTHVPRMLQLYLSRIVQNALPTDSYPWIFWIVNAVKLINGRLIISYLIGHKVSNVSGEYYFVHEYELIQLTMVKNTFRCSRWKYKNNKCIKKQCRTAFSIDSKSMPFPRVMMKFLKRIKIFK